jgi:tRNA (guanine37-N1)-methyltransferase
MRFEIVTIFPEVFPGVLQVGVAGQALMNNLIQIHCHNPRDCTTDKHRSVDDAPFGGGAGMLMKPAPLFDCIESLGEPEPFVILLSPQGIPFNQKIAGYLVDNHDRIAFICGRYEGVDERVRSNLADMDVSVGDYVLSGGEIAAMAIVETITRLIPGVVGNAESLTKESLENNLLKYPQYTRPRNYRGLEVPEILLSGNHAAIDEWRNEQARIRTVTRRPDLFTCKDLDKNDTYRNASFGDNDVKQRKESE